MCNRLVYEDYLIESIEIDVIYIYKKKRLICSIMTEIVSCVLHVLIEFSASPDYASDFIVNTSIGNNNTSSSAISVSLLTRCCYYAQRASIQKHVSTIFYRSITFVAQAMFALWP